MLHPHDRMNFETLCLANDHGDLALVAVQRVADGQVVAAICAMQREADGSITVVPLALMIEGNPYALFTPPSPGITVVAEEDPRCIH